MDVPEEQLSVLRGKTGDRAELVDDFEKKKAIRLQIVSHFEK
jgi:hypothetical protein